MRAELHDPNCTVMIKDAMGSAKILDRYNLYGACYLDGVQLQSKEEFIVNSNMKRMGLAPLEKKTSIAANNTTVGWERVLAKVVFLGNSSLRPN